MTKRSAGDAGLDWPSLGFNPQPVNGYAKVVWSAGEGWSQPEFEAGDHVKLPIWANVLHYGQSIFEGQKVFHCKDGKVKIFNDAENYERLLSGCHRLMLPEPTLALFQACIDLAVKKNVEFIPPYGSGCSLYVRPVLFGNSPQVSLHPATEAILLVMVTPVSVYYKGGSLTPVVGGIVEHYDRAAPKGVGHCKVAGNYAADMKAGVDLKKLGFAIGLYLDPKEGRYIEEFNTSNFVAIIGNKYVTPLSSSILPSVTNKCLCLLAADVGMEVERRPIDFLEEVDTFDEVGALGTAVVVTPLKSLSKGEQTWQFKAPTRLQELHDKIKRIQVGEEEDKHGFLRPIEV